MPSAQTVQWAKLRITIVVVSAMAVLSVLIYLLSGGTWLKPKIIITTHIPDSTGLAHGSDVELNGVDVGKVEWLRLTKEKDPNRVVEVGLKIQEQFLTHIPEDSITEIDSENLLGDRFIDITMGKSPQPVRPGGDLRFKPPSDFLKNIDMQQFEVQLRTIEQTIRDVQDGKGPLGQFVTTAQMYEDVLNGISKVEAGLRAATATNTQLGQFLYGATMYDDLRTPLRQLDARLAELQSSPYLRDPWQYDQLRDQIAQLRSKLADLHAGKGSAGALLSSDATYRDWNRRLAAWIASVDALNSGEGAFGQMLAGAQTYESLNGTLRDFAATVRDFREHPQKFLRLKIF